MKNYGKAIAAAALPHASARAPLHSAQRRTERRGSRLTRDAAGALIGTGWRRTTLGRLSSRLLLCDPVVGKEWTPLDADRTTPKGGKN